MLESRLKGVGEESWAQVIEDHPKHGLEEATHREIDERAVPTGETEAAEVC